MDRILALFAYTVLLAFLGILVWNVPQLDLGLVVLATLVLAGVDIVQVLRQHRRQKRED
ncbi:hypothetical protein [Paracoccus sp. SCSIO 75233]|uniref:hypothetical protein n=1 Tax=Paracoccus sp. SCSIO 75233 TaxID=3017782 RepID=UPI0022F0DFE7|nr:hypothetical protein [Paracoccus sp. SCSIO 75233]WBU52050.1 hypothetical protein PAF12_09350 [Paracoccus sp. SCSIO 75233]